MILEALLYLIGFGFAAFTAYEQATIASAVQMTIRDIREGRLGDQWDGVARRHLIAANASIATCSILATICLWRLYGMTGGAA